MADEAGIEATLADRPDLEPAVETVHEIDQRHDTWTFEDVPLDSGTFGELVSRGLVEDDGDGYRLADPEAVRAALDGEPGDGNDPTTNVSLPTPSLPAFDRTTAAIVGAALAFVALVRTYPLPTVYRNGDVVLSGNDPYYYRYWVEQVVAESVSPFDFGALAALPEAVRTGEPFMVATLWWIAEFVGSGATAVGHVLAWYPVASAVLTAGLVYLLAVRLTTDRRVGVASILLLAVIPGYATRTSLGFADHHAFDYPWLVVTALALVWLASVEREDLASPRTALASLVLGVAVTGQVLAWEAGPLLVAPVGLVVAGRALVDVRADRSPLVAGAPVVAGLAVAAGLAWLAHAVADWHRIAVALSPTVVLVVVAAVLVAAEAIHRTTGDLRHLAAVDVLAVVGGALAVQVLVPEAWAELQGRLHFLLGEHEAVETFGLFSPRTHGYLLLMGLTLVLAVPVMGMYARRATRDGRWLVAIVYAWYFFGLASVQTRFIGEFGAFAALFAGLGFVHLAAWVDLVDPPDVETAGVAAGARQRLAGLAIPGWRTLGVLFALFLLFGAFGGGQTVIKTDQITVGDATYETAVAIEEHAADRELTYPGNYVLSRWGYNRIFNYFVNGEAASYSYAQAHYADFGQDTDPDGWYEQFEGRVGYLAVQDRDTASEMIHHRLSEAYGSREAGVAGLGHYQAIDARGSWAAFALVDGATLTGSAPAGETVTVATDVSIPGASFTYERQTTASDDGEFGVRVAYPGEYTVTAGGETRTVDVGEAAVEDGTEVGA